MSESNTSEAYHQVKTDNPNDRWPPAGSAGSFRRASGADADPEVEEGPFFVEQAEKAAADFGQAFGTLKFLGLANPTFSQVVEFIEKSQSHAEKALEGQQAARLRFEERQLQLRRDQNEEEAKAAERQLQLQKERRLEQRINFEARLRGLLALILVLGSLGGVLFGVFTEIKPQALTQYLAPIIGLAGIVVGYCFGREAKGRVRPVDTN